MTRKILIVVVIYIIAFFALLASNPLQRSEADIKRQMLEVTPIGSEYSHVLTTVKQRGWYRGGSGSADGQIIDGDIGPYHSFPHRRSVVVSWVFTLGTNLTDIRVVK